MDDEVGLDYIVKHFDPHTTPAGNPHPGACSLLMATAPIFPILLFNMDSTIVLPYIAFRHIQRNWCSLWMSHALDPSQAYRTALDDFIYGHPPGQPFGKQEFWQCLCIARDQALSQDNILSGFEVSGIWPLQSEVALNHGKAADTDTSSGQELPVELSTPLRMANIRTSLKKLTSMPMSPYSQAVIHESVEYLEKVIQHRILEPSKKHY